MTEEKKEPEEKAEVEDSNPYISPIPDREYIPDSTVADIVMHVAIYKTYRDLKKQTNHHHLVHCEEKRYEAYVPTNDDEEAVDIVKKNLEAAKKEWTCFGELPIPSGEYIKLGSPKI